MPSRRTTTILPAFYSDNCLNLMPGAKRQITIDLPHANAPRYRASRCGSTGGDSIGRTAGSGSAVCRSGSTSAR
ncbi:hypothetical protein [Burkholderia cenocepacia]|uniref:hypothetical protein n=1 Tax=Burkholderia cenocepacia TaxID=95486 RepID=UPI000AFCCDF7|nr:hypothetical protein [Burkholderia cenocepacia]MCW3687060.1 hypothetical protein [Burkholderia cenocepacia]